MVNQATAIETRLERSYLSQYEERAASSGGGRRSAAAAPRSPDSRRMRAEFQASQAGARSRSGRPIASNPNRMADEEFCELFGEKAVNELSCKYCCSDLSRRGMRALLLADHAVELFSTDGEPRGWYVSSFCFVCPNILRNPYSVHTHTPTRTHAHARSCMHARALHVRNRLQSCFAESMLACCIPSVCACSFDWLWCQRTLVCLCVGVCVCVYIYLF